MTYKFEPKSLSLGWFSPTEIQKISVIEVTIPTSFDAFGHPIPEGLYDLRMGPLNLDQSCQHCKLGFRACPGHFGHIKLSRPVLNPMAFETCFALFKSCCFNCSHFKITSLERISIYTKLKAIRKGLNIQNVESFIGNKTLEEIEKDLNALKEEFTGHEQTDHYETVNVFIKKISAKVTCPRCHSKSPKITKDSNLMILKTEPTGLIDTISPQAVRDLITLLYTNETALLMEMFNSTEYAHFFLDVIPVVPNKFRPANFIADRVSESHINSHLGRILNNSVLVENDERFYNNLQSAVLYYFDSSKSPTETFIGHKQILEKKDGLFRKNIMGKRVNYAARSVISPDPNLETREVGVPLCFATQLTFPEKVTSFNFDRLRKMVINGKTYPGANFVECNGALTNLDYISPDNRLALANQLMAGSKVVWRHLLDGDPLLMNRQPTLHSISLMGHLAKILKNEKTLRLHYVNCKSYNADFDGDEMNMHFPQSLPAHSEIYNLALNDNSYFVASSGDPVRGLTQDHIIAAACCTFKDAFFSPEEFMSIIDHSISNLTFKKKLMNSNYLKFCEPCILSPLPLYSGKQIVSMILKNFNCFINFEVKSKLMFPGEESFFKVFRGEVISGVLDKAAVGGSSYSLIHACGEIYGYSICNDLLTVFSRMVNRYMTIKGFTVRYDDLLLSKDSNKIREQTFLKGNSDAVAYQEMGCPDNFKEIPLCSSLKSDQKGHPLFKREDFYFDQAKLTVLDRKVKNFMTEVRPQLSNVLETGMFKKFPTNNMANMILSGSKGAIVNLSQISASLGQQELEGKRVPVMLSGKTLPCFKKMELSPCAGGFIFERFLTGINPATFYFHCMAGREGLIDTAIKTANSGYLQRCIAKQLEGVSIKYDGTVRLDNKIVQFRFGDDGLNVIKGSYLKNTDFYKKNLNLFKHSSARQLTESQNSLISNSYRDVIALEPENVKNFLENRFLNSFASPGHPVGIIAAQSIGEPSTQMTLNTFHLAGVGGKNVTLGIPRLREIIMVASKAIKTPIISLPLYDTSKSDMILSIFKKITLEDCFENVTVEESIVKRSEEFKKLIKITFDICDCIDETIKTIDVGFLKMLGKDLKKRSSASGITECNERALPDKVLTENEEPDEDESSESSSKTEVNLDMVIEDEDKTENMDSKYEEEVEDEVESEEESYNLLNLKKISATKYSFEIFYPVDFNILLMPIIESIASRMIVKEIKGFEKATFSDGFLHLEGSDFLSLISIIEEKNLRDSVDFYKSQTNDIYSIYKTFGVEAARELIVHEISGVFDAYGINVNIRHLYLVADFMTREGTYKSFSRHSFSMDDCFIQKMSFESCFTNLKSAVTFNQSEPIESPSACLLTGKPIKSGTGSFEILYDLKQWEE